MENEADAFGREHQPEKAGRDSLFDFLGYTCLLSRSSSATPTEPSHKRKDIKMAEMLLLPQSMVGNNL